MKKKSKKASKCTLHEQNNSFCDLTSLNTAGI